MFGWLKWIFWCLKRTAHTKMSSIIIYSPWCHSIFCGTEFSSFFIYIGLYNKSDWKLGLSSAQKWQSSTINAVQKTCGLYIKSFLICIVLLSCIKPYRSQWAAKGKTSIRCLDEEGENPWEEPDSARGAQTPWALQ